jgi:hypothetical protein
MSINRDASKFWDGNRTDKSICVDLDSTLIHTFTDIKTISRLNVFNGKNRELRRRLYVLDLHDVVSTPGTGIYSQMWGAFRPSWFRFHDFCRKYFKHIIIWSAGQPRYVEAVTDVLFPDPDFQPIAVYNWNQCVFDDNNIYKPLDLLYKDPKLAGLIDPTNTFVLDDRDDTFSKNFHNGLLIPAYKILPNERSIMKDDDALIKLEEWLCTKEVVESKDIRNLRKDNIFNTRRDTTRRSSTIIV